MNFSVSFTAEGQTEIKTGPKQAIYSVKALIISMGLQFVIDCNQMCLYTLYIVVLNSVTVSM